MYSSQINRQQLYDLLWSEPYSVLSEKYKISEYTLVRKCMLMNVPYPDAGYWFMKDSGKEPDRKPLLPDKSADQWITFRTRETGDFEPHAVKDLQMEIEADPEINLKVPLKLTNPDKMILLAKDKLEERSNSKHYYKNEIINCFEDCLDIQVSKTEIGRALRFMDTLIKALRQRGHEIKKQYRDTFVVIYGEELKISCRENQTTKFDKNERDWQRYKSTGILSFRVKNIWDIATWNDGSQLLETKLSKIIATLELLGYKEHLKRLEREENWRIREEKERIKKELQARKDQELKDFKSLFKKAQRRDQADIVRNYINDLEKWAIDHDKLTQEMKEHINWARKKADWIDPFIEGEDELMGDVDREKLEF